MADKKISALTAASTPLAGTEVIPIVQSGTTVKATANDVFNATQSAGTANAVIYLNGSKVPVNGNAFTFDGTSVLRMGSGGSAVVGTLFYLQGSDNAASGSATISKRGTSNAWIAGDYQAAFGSGTGYLIYTYGAIPTVWHNSAVGEQGRWNGVDLKLTQGNLVQGAAAKGVNFTANTPAAGMTSQLLNWYEEGTWTPTVDASSGSVTSYTVNSATYTRIGRVVVLNFDYTITNNGTGSVGTLISNLPFNIGSLACAGSAREILSIGLSGTITPFSATQLYLCRYDNAYLGGNNYRIIGSITYNA